MLFKLAQDYLTFFILNCLFLQIVKTYKYQKSKHFRWLHTLDLTLIASFSAIASLLLTLKLWPVTAIILTAYFLLYTLYTIDGFVTHKYGYEVNPNSIKLFFGDTADIAAAVDDPIDVIKDYYRLFLSPLLFFGGVCLYTSQHLSAYYCYAGVLVWFFCLVVFKAKINRKTCLPWLAVLLAIELVIIGSLMLPSAPHTLINILALLVLLSIIGLFILRNKMSHLFFTLPSFFSELFFPSSLRQQTNLQVESKDEEIIQVNYSKSQTINATLPEDCHIVFITLESVSEYYREAKETNGANMPFLQKLQQQGWSSKYHICLSANTNSSFETLFSGGYYSPLQFNYLPTLHQHGYHTLTLTNSDNSGGTYELLQKIGFQEILYTKTFDLNNQIPDQQFFELCLPMLKQKVAKGEKLFIHVKNGQTHVPYYSFKEQRAHNLKDRYIDTCEEADAAIAELITQLYSFIPKEKLLIVYTADHGQSFGQHSYRIHSNSIIKQQLNVPLAIYHPQLQTATTNFSSHFDLFPTVFSLCGIPIPDNKLGNVLFSESDDFSYIIYSATRKGNAPSCFGHINKTRKLFFDLVYQRAYEMDLEDNIVRSLSSRERKYYDGVFWEALHNRGIAK